MVKYGVNSLFSLPGSNKALNKMTTSYTGNSIKNVTEKKVETTNLKEHKEEEKQKQVISSSNASGELTIKEEKKIKKEIIKKEDKLDDLYNAPEAEVLDDYNTRDLSGLDFNKRVLKIAADQRKPLFERAKYLSIYSSNIDEFLSVRYGNAINEASKNDKHFDVEIDDLFLPGQEKFLLQHINLIYNQNVIPTYNLLMNQMKGKGVLFVSKLEELTNNDYEYIKNYFLKNIKPALTPLVFDNNRPIPKLTSHDINVAYVVSDEEERLFGFIKIPKFFNRMIQIPSDDFGGVLKVMLIEDVVAMFLSAFFHKKNVEKAAPFRVLKNSDVSSSKKDAKPTTEIVEDMLAKRNITKILRLEVYGDSEEITTMLTNIYKVHKKSVIRMKTPFDLKFLMDLDDLDIPEEIKRQMSEETFEPVIVKELVSEQSVVQKVKKQDVLIHHPYESYESVLDYIDELANDPKVLSIKMTLYRTAKKSRIVEALGRAAMAGKNVTVVTELKARFDEENNIKTARYLEDCGANVIYGFKNKKVHAKLFLATRESKNGIQKFAHVGTGNYNENNAKIYTDFSLLTSNPEVTDDIEKLFDMLTGFSTPDLDNIISLPKSFRQELIKMIDNEIRFGRDGYFCLKVNHIADKEIIDKIYEAASKGVKIDLIVRTSCSVISDPRYKNLRIISNVGRFLEHHRVYYFKHLNADNHDEDMDAVFISSSDLMKRNLDHRVECTTRILDKNAKKKIMQILALYLQDDSCYEMRDNQFVLQKGKTIDVQEVLIKKTKDRVIQVENDENIFQI